MDFSKRYSSLNTAQKEAVDTIDGPVMVIAGPGTGKTELLSVRAANILKQTDTLPENILCLTFTDSGAGAMRERLTEIIGKNAYKIAVHTFHSFGAEVINQYGQFFYQGAHFRLSDELSSYEIMRDIFNQLDYNSPIASKLNDEYTHLSDALTVISELKKSGLTSDELLVVLDENNAVIEKVEQLLSPILLDRINKTTVSKLTQHTNAIRNSGVKTTHETITPLSHIIADSLETAADESVSMDSTKPITAWKNRWFKKDDQGKYILKSHERQAKLRALCFVYEQYLSHMQSASLYDYDDMILRVVHAMEIFNDLRFNLQEKYQYILVDEFQDTNMAQMRILHNLTNNVSQGDTPNIMVVGDDDQAIYSFQGADISNILNFRNIYPSSKLITLTENYRSSSNILSGSRDIIKQGSDRLENVVDELNKDLTANNKQKSTVKVRELETAADERLFIVDDIKSKIKSGKNPNDIAVITRRHSEIETLLPYFANAGISVNYERRDNVLDIAPIKLIEQIARLLVFMSNSQHDDVNALMPVVLAHPAWGIKPVDLWKLSLKAYDGHSRWLDVMSVSPNFKQIQEWLVQTASLVNDTPLEQILGIIIGKSNSADVDGSAFTSPFYDHFFSKDTLENHANDYLTYLEALRTIRNKLRNYQPNNTPTLASFIEFINLNRRLGATISITRRSVQDDKAVNIMTAHKSKGLEFDTVYLFNAVDTVWGIRARNHNRLINYPENLPLAPAGETEDERLRLFYVATTRAKNNLSISYSLKDDNDRNTLPVAFIVESKWQNEHITSPADPKEQIESAELAWYQPLIDPISNSMNDLLLPSLADYKLSVTHLHGFLDVTRGGPATFLMNNLLHFPQAKTPNAAFGTAVHETLRNAHSHIRSAGKQQAIEDIVSNFEQNLTDQYLSRSDFGNLLQKGSDALRAFLDEKYSTFTPNQQTELDFTYQHVIIDKAHITGKLDLVETNKSKKTISITDYKTGKPSSTWSGKTDYDRVKLHKYRQQLLFYKLLVENARDYRGYQVSSGIMQFVEPSRSGKICSLEIDFDSDEIRRFTELINAVWERITKLDLPDVSNYEQSYKGILKFEQDLLDNIV